MTILKNAKHPTVISRLTSALLLLGLAAPGWAYEDATVVNGGRVTGRVILTGAPPPARIYHLVFSPNPDFCGKISDGRGNRLLKEFSVSDDGGLQSAVVAVVGVPKGKPFTYAQKIDIENCRLTPFVMPVRHLQPIEIVNHDGISHDLQAYTLKDNYTFAMFNKPMAPKSEAVKTVVFRPDNYIFRTQCGVHDFMQSWGMAVGNPYFAVTGPDGRFTIPDLPPGDYDIIAWHPRLRVQAGHISVPPNGEAVIDFRFNAADVHIPEHDLQAGYRLQTALAPLHLAPPSIELQTP